MLGDYSEEELSKNDIVVYLHASAAYQLLHAAVELGIFELLHQKSTMALEEIAKRLKLKTSAARTLLFGLTAMRLIRKSNETYENSKPIQDMFLHNEFKLFRSMVGIQAHIMYIGQTDFVDSLKKDTNVGVNRVPGKGKTIYKKLANNLKLRKIFYDYMEAYSDYANPHLLEKVDFNFGRIGAPPL